MSTLSFVPQYLGGSRCGRISWSSHGCHFSLGVISTSTFSMSLTKVHAYSHSTTHILMVTILITAQPARTEIFRIADKCASIWTYIHMPKNFSVISNLALIKHIFSRPTHKSQVIGIPKAAYHSDCQEKPCVRSTSTHTQLFLIAVRPSK